jgi:hypothetical protein
VTKRRFQENSLVPVNLCRLQYSISDSKFDIWDGEACGKIFEDWVSLVLNQRQMLALADEAT